MPRPFQCVVATVLVMASISCSDSPIEPAGSLFTGVVGNGELHLTLPLPSRASWMWDQVAAGDGELEYKWTGTIVNGGEQYELGFFKWKTPSAIPESGTFQEMLQSGQSSVFHFDPSSGTSNLVVSGQVATFAAGDSLVIRVIDPTTLALLTSGDPGEATLTRIERGQPTETETVQLEYRP